MLVNFVFYYFYIGFYLFVLYKYAFYLQDSDGDKSDDNLVVDVSNEVRLRYFPTLEFDSLVYQCERPVHVHFVIITL